MLRVLFWAASAVGLGWLCWHFAAWRVAGQVALVWVFFMWVALGGWLVSRSLGARPKGRQPSVIEKQHYRALAARQLYVNVHGNDAAVRLETLDPNCWLREAENLEAKP